MGKNLRYPRPEALPHDGNRDFYGRVRGLWRGPDNDSTVCFTQPNCSLLVRSSGFAYMIEHQDRAQGIPGNRWRGNYVPQLCGDSGNGTRCKVCIVWEYHFLHVCDCIPFGAGDWWSYH